MGRYWIMAKRAALASKHPQPKAGPIGLSLGLHRPTGIVPALAFKHPQFKPWSRNVWCPVHEMRFLAAPFASYWLDELRTFRKRTALGKHLRPPPFAACCFPW